MQFFLERPVAALCISAALVAASIFIIAQSFNRVDAEETGAWTLTFRHYGIDMEEIERSITIPLEDALSSIDGIQNIVSVSENGSARVFIKTQNGRYEAVRDAAQRIYETLPSSAQKPEIIAADSTGAPVWSAAVFVRDGREGGTFNLNNFLEKILKPALAGLEGAANVEIAGSGINEIVINLYAEEAALLGIGADYIAQILSQNDITLPAGFIIENEKNIPITVTSRYKSIEDLRSALIPLPSGGIIKLSSIASVEEQEREAETITRLNGTKAAVVLMLPSDDADTGKLSKKIKLEIEKLTSIKNYPVEFIVLADRGEEEAKAFRSALIAALQAAAAVAILSALLTRKQRNAARRAAACALFVPLAGITAAALLSIVGVRFDKTMLAGLAAGIGAAVDAALLCAEKLGGAKNIIDAKKELRSLAPPLISGALTTIIALLPLLFLPFTAAGITILAAAIAAVTFAALVLSLTLFPVFVINGGKSPPRCSPPRPQAVLGGLSLPPLRGLCPRNAPALFPIAAAFLVTVLGAAALLKSGVRVQEDEASGSLFARIEFEGGLRADEADKRLESWAKHMMAHEGIINVQTGAKLASGNVLISYDVKKLEHKKARDMAREEPVQGGFVYINETSVNESLWEIKVFGDSAEECRAIVQRIAEVCGAFPFVQQAVFNFKEGSRRMLLKPQREKIAMLESQNSISFSALANTARNAVFGPVVYKRIDKTANTEVDVRIKGAGNKTLTKNDVLNIIIPAGEGGTARLQSFVQTEEQTGFSSLRRENRRRCASLTIRTAAADPRKIRAALAPTLKKIELSRGYSIDFDPEAIKSAENLSNSVFYFLLALIFCYIIIAAANESFLLPLAVLAVVPPSAAVPVCVMAALGIPFNSAALCAFIVVCGLAVNAAVLIACEIKNESQNLMNEAVRRRAGALIATSGTTIASALPFLFLRENSNEVIRTLSLVTASGVAASAFFALSLVPALARIAPVIFYPKEVMPKQR